MVSFFSLPVSAFIPAASNLLAASKIFATTLKASLVILKALSASSSASRQDCGISAGAFSVTVFVAVAVAVAVTVGLAVGVEVLPLPATPPTPSATTAVMAMAIQPNRFGFLVGGTGWNCCGPYWGGGCL